MVAAPSLMFTGSVHRQGRMTIGLPGRAFVASVPQRPGLFECQQLFVDESRDRLAGQRFSQTLRKPTGGY
jgi:hypothetical protein